MITVENVEAREAGEIPLTHGGVLGQGAAKHADVIYAAIVLLADDGDFIVTSDRDNLRGLATLGGCHVELIEP